jgi:hypothetical protein
MAVRTLGEDDDPGTWEEQSDETKEAWNNACARALDKLRQKAARAAQRLARKRAGK